MMIYGSTTLLVHGDARAFVNLKLVNTVVVLIIHQRNDHSRFTTVI